LVNELLIADCLYGPNLNLFSVRGFANLSDLAVISAPDEYDQLSNEAVVQRSPAAKHAKEALEYALSSSVVDPNSDPRSFPEIILNVRDSSVLIVQDCMSGRDVPLETLSFIGAHGAKFVNLNFNLDLINTDDLAFRGPQVSRVDGNHRLLQSTKLLKSGDFTREDFPLVPFSLYIGLSQAQERKLFMDINKNHKSMSSSLIVHFSATTSDIYSTKSTRVDRANWIAERLTNENRVFERMVNKGGSLTNYKYMYGRVPPLTLVGIRNCLKDFLQSGHFWSSRFEADGETQVEWVDRYFAQIRSVFPEEWNNERDFALLKAVGLGAFSMLGGTLFNNFGDSYNEEIINTSLLMLKRDVNFERLKWAGYTGQSGMRVMYRRFMDLMAQEGLERHIRAIPI
jgi:DGQHR domain-containing protein